MGYKNNGKSPITVGQAVEINPRDDKTRKLRVSGIIDEILTKNMAHPHGILVRLESGEIGRVKQAVDLNIVSGRPKDQDTGGILLLIDGGENHKIEFKTDALWSANYTTDDIKKHRPQTKELHTFGKATSKVIIAKTLAAFLNSDGGNFIIGYKEGKGGEVDEIVGIGTELNKLRDSSIDGYRRMLIELIKEYFPASLFNHFNLYFCIRFEKLDDKTLCNIAASKSDKRVFLKLNGKDFFFVRVDASTRELKGEEIIDFCDSRFK